MSESFDQQLARLRAMVARHPSDYSSDEDFTALAELLRRWDAVLSFVSALASEELCDDSHKARQCSPDSGPYCQSHRADWFGDEVMQARALAHVSRGTLLAESDTK